MVAAINPLRVLVVDDERAIADSLAMILRMAECEVRVAYSAEAAIDCMHDFMPDVAITDILMGEMNGVELGFYITDYLPGCTVLLCSGLAETGAILDGVDGRSVSFRMYTKPVHPQVLLDLIASETARRAEAPQKRPPANDDSLGRRGKLLPFPSHFHA